MDAFEVMGVGRGLVFSEEELRQAFREAGKRAHPDAGGDEDRFAELQQAFGILLSPSRRLRHWLESGGIRVDDRGSVGDGVSDLFGMVGGVLQQASDVERKRGAAASALAKAMLEDEVQRSREALEEAIGRVDAALAAECGRFPELELAPGEPAGSSVRTLAFLEKWRSELRACYAKLAI